jgi:hypothetical protein
MQSVLPTKQRGLPRYGDAFTGAASWVGRGVAPGLLRSSLSGGVAASEKPLDAVSAEQPAAIAALALDASATKMSFQVKGVLRDAKRYRLRKR